MSESNILAWENEDGDAWVAVAESPDMEQAGRAYAEQCGLGVIFEGRVRVRTQDCECVPTGDHCPDAEAIGEDEDGNGIYPPCHVVEDRECWHFTTWDGIDLWNEIEERQDAGGEVAYWTPAKFPARPVRTAEIKAIRHLRDVTSPTLPKGHPVEWYQGWHRAIDAAEEALTALVSGGED